MPEVCPFHPPSLPHGLSSPPPSTHPSLPSPVPSLESLLKGHCSLHEGSPRSSFPQHTGLCPSPQTVASTGVGGSICFDLRCVLHGHLLDCFSEESLRDKWWVQGPATPPYTRVPPEVPRPRRDWSGLGCSSAARCPLAGWSVTAAIWVRLREPRASWPSHVCRSATQKPSRLQHLHSVSREEAW